MARSTLLSLALLLATVSLARGGSIANPNTPKDGIPVADMTRECVMETLEFTNGFKLSPPFQSNRFHYKCDGDYSAGGFTTVAKPWLRDDYSTAEVALNGAHVNFRSEGKGISNYGVAFSSPLKQSDTITFRAGSNTLMIGVGCNGLAQPEPCYYQYVITCDKSGSIVGDPQFVGLRGQDYQVHGVSGEVYNIVSDVDLQYNSRFVFLDRGACPVVNGVRQKGCYSHPGSYLGELGLKTSAGDHIHVVSGQAGYGFVAVTVNGRAVQVGSTVLLAEGLGSISRNSTHLASVQIGDWEFEFENSDMFINQKVRVADVDKLRSHGMLGQTWRKTTYPNAIRHIQGTVDDYTVRGGDIFGDDFVFNVFN